MLYKSQRDMRYKPKKYFAEKYCCSKRTVDRVIALIRGNIGYLYPDYVVSDNYSNLLRVDEATFDDAWERRTKYRCGIESPPRSLSSV